MYPPVVTRNPEAVEAEVQAAYLKAFPNGDREAVPRAFGWTVECFAGRYKDYQAIDAPYHDLEHTLQGTLCLARLLLGRHRTATEPLATPRMFQLGIVAILMHDTGYLKKRGDTQGTGAKYTVTHVHRSAQFAAELLAEKGFGSAEIKAVQNMIHCTGLNTNLTAIPFQSDLEKVVGFALATADLLGQMAASDYADKLPLLFSEFAEAARFANDPAHFVSMYSSAEELITKTPDFWRGFVKPKLDHDFAGVYRFLNDPYPDGTNEYLDRVEANMDRLRGHATATVT